MSTVHDIRTRVLRERLEQLRDRAHNIYADDDFIRLATLGLALLDRHHLDHRGRCPHCRAYRGRWRRRSRTCTVLHLITWHLQRPPR
ncbi:MAG TPA: hypothetical protein VGJ13_04000 [Pseudonocardiaceae bacterium]